MARASYYSRNRKIIRVKQNIYASTEAARIAKKIYNQRYRQENKTRIQQQRKSKRTEEFRSRKREYYRNNRHRFLLSNAKSRAARLGLPFNLELSDIQIPLVCPILKIPLLVEKSKSPNSPSVDRIIPSMGYIKANVQIISWRANNLKRDASFEELIALGKWAKRVK